MNKVLNVLITIMLVFFLVYPIMSIFESEKDNRQENEVKVLVEEFKLEFEEFCVDPFSSSKFEVMYIVPFKVYVNESKVCASGEGGFIYCERVSCEVSDGVIFEGNSFEKVYLCEMSLDGELVVECE